MKKATAKTTKQTAAKKAAGNSAGKTPPVTKQPQSKQQAAVSGGMFLHADDRWSLAYFDESDLHCIERKLFG